MSLVPTFQAAGTLAEGTGAISVTWPSHLVNDVGLLFVETANQPVATPSGWNAVTNGSQGIGAAAGLTATRLQVFWRRADTASQAVAAVADSGDHTHGVILTFRGCVQSGDPVNASAGSATTDANSTAVSFPSITTTVANCLVVMGIANQTDTDTDGQIGTVTNGSLTSITERFDQNDATQSNGGGIAVITGIRAATGTVSAGTATLTTTSRQGRLVLALLPMPDIPATGSVSLQKPVVSASATVAFPNFTGTANLPEITSSGSAVVSSPSISAEGNVSLPQTTSSGTASVAVSSTGSVSLPEVTSAGSAVVAITFSGSISLPQSAATGSSVVSVSSTGSASLPEVASLGSSTVLVSSTGVSTLPVAVVTGSSSVSVSSAGSVSLSEITASGSVSVQVSCSGTALLQKPTSEGTTSTSIVVSGTAQLPRPSAVASASVTVQASGTAVLPEVTSSGSCSILLTTSGTCQLPTAASSGNIAVPVTFIGNITLPLTSVLGQMISGTATSGSVTLITPQSEGNITVSVQAIGESSLPSPQCSGSASISVASVGNLSLPSTTVTGEIFPEPIDNGELFNNSVSLPSTGSTGSVSVLASVTGTVVLVPVVATGLGATEIQVTGNISLPLVLVSTSFDPPPSPTIPDKPMTIVESSSTYEVTENINCTVELQEGKLFVTLSLS